MTVVSDMHFCNIFDWKLGSVISDIICFITYQIFETGVIDLKVKVDWNLFLSIFMFDLNWKYKNLRMRSYQTLTQAVKLLLKHCVLCYWHLIYLCTRWWNETSGMINFITLILKNLYIYWGTSFSFPNL